MVFLEDFYMRKIILLLVCSLYLFGCHSTMSAPEMTAIVSGRVDVIDRHYIGKDNVREDKALGSWQLSNGQLGKLYIWLKLHQSDWGVNVVSSPAPSYSIFLVHSDGSHSQINLFSMNESWQHAVHIDVTDKSGKYVFMGALSLSSDDIFSLKKLLSEERQ